MILNMIGGNGGTPVADTLSLGTEKTLTVQSARSATFAFSSIPEGATLRGVVIDLVSAYNFAENVVKTMVVTTSGDVAVDYTSTNSHSLEYKSGAASLSVNQDGKSGTVTDTNNNYNGFYNAYSGAYKVVPIWVVQS